MKARWVGILVLATLALSAAGPARAGRDDPRLEVLANECLDRWLSHHPDAATRLGDHGRDRRAFAVTEATLDDDLAWARDLRRRLSGVVRAELSFDKALEYDLLMAWADRELLDLETLRPFETRPDAYVDLTAGTILPLVQSDFSPLCFRLLSVVKRMRQFPEVLRAARINLKRPPRIATELAIAQFEGALRFYRGDLAAWGARCKDASTQGDLAEATREVVLATEAFLVYLREDLLPRSDGSFALGREALARRLAGDAMEAESLDSLLERANRELGESRRRLDSAAERVAPGLGIRGALEALAGEAPASGAQVGLMATRLDSMRAFLRERDLVSLPMRDRLAVRRAPPFATGFEATSVVAPGAWERRSSDAYLDVAPAEPGWPEDRRREHLARFNPYAASILAAREMPGHYVERLAHQGVRSRLRQALGPRCAGDAWAHYCEQMAVEEGLGAGDPRFELAQRVSARRAIGRLIVALSMHAQGMTLDAAAAWLREHCDLSGSDADREARACALDPTATFEVLGKWRILELREAVRQRLGSRFRLRGFHDAFLAQAGLAVPATRAALLREIDGKRRRAGSSGSLISGDPTLLGETASSSDSTRRARAPSAGLTRLATSR